MSDNDLTVKTFRQSVSDRLKDTRNALGLSQSDLAKRTGFQPSAISHFETGQRSPSIASLRILSDALGVATDYLLGKTSDPNGAVKAQKALSEIERLKAELEASRKRETAMRALLDDAPHSVYCGDFNLR